MANRYDVDPSDAIEWGNSDNKGLVIFSPALPAFTGGGTLPNAVSPSRVPGSFTANPLWDGANLRFGSGSYFYPSLQTPINTANFIIAATIRPAGTSLGLVFGTNADASNLWLGTASNLQLSINGGSQSGGSIAANQEYRIVATRFGSQTCLYIDGRIVSTQAQLGSVPTLGYAIGKFGVSSGFAWSGLLRDFRFHIGFGADSGWVARDRAGSADTASDPRIRTLRGVSVFAPLSISTTNRRRRIITAGLT